jgi:hypothetical protein
VRETGFHVVGVRAEADGRFEPVTLPPPSHHEGRVSSRAAGGGGGGAALFWQLLQLLLLQLLLLQLLLLLLLLLQLACCRYCRCSSSLAYRCSPRVQQVVVQQPDGRQMLAAFGDPYCAALFVRDCIQRETPGADVSSTEVNGARLAKGLLAPRLKSGALPLPSPSTCSLELTCARRQTRGLPGWSTTPSPPAVGSGAGWERRRRRWRSAGAASGGYEQCEGVHTIRLQLIVRSLYTTACRRSSEASVALGDQPTQSARQTSSCFQFCGEPSSSSGSTHCLSGCIDSSVLSRFHSSHGRRTGPPLRSHQQRYQVRAVNWRHCAKKLIVERDTEVEREREHACEEHLRRRAAWPWPFARSPAPRCQPAPRSPSRPCPLGTASHPRSTPPAGLSAAHTEC